MSNAGSGPFAIDPSLEPKDRADGSRRLAFFSAAAAAVCARALQSLLDRARAGEFGEQVRAATVHPFPDQAFNSAVKSLSAVFIYLVMVDQGATAPDWLQSFLGTSARALDRLARGPAVKEILQLHEFVAGYDVCPEAALDVCRALGIAHLSGDFANPVRQFLEGSRKMRFEMLRFALGETYEALDQRLAQLHPAG